MGGEKIILSAAETVSMSAEAAKKLISAGDGDAALLYILILAGGGAFDRADAAARLHRTAEQIDSSLASLARMGLVRPGAVPDAPSERDELPQYSSEDITRELTHGAAFKDLVRDVQTLLGKILSSDDLIKLFGIYDHLGLPTDVILLLISHCIEECSRRYGTSRRPTMRYIEKAAYTWEREGIFSLSAAEAYLQRMVREDAETEKFAGALQIRGRALIAQERRYISEWIAMGFAPEAAAEAYDRTVMKTGKMSWSYINSIMKSWHSKGLHTLTEIESGDGKAPAQKAAPAKGGISAAAVARNREALERLKKEG